MIEQEYCHAGHLRTPQTTYVNPRSNKRQCRVCSGKMPADVSKGVDLTGFEGRIFTQKELECLRMMVRCMGCGAVPRETGARRTTTNQHGERVDLPVVATDHAEGCPVAAQAPRRGRPRTKPQPPKHKQAPAGHCEVCAEAIYSSFGRPKKYCTETCRQQAKRARRKAGV